MKPKEKNNKGRLLVVSGPSGVGKGTVLAELLKMSGDYDHRIVNDGLEEAVNELEKLILKYIG